MRLKTWTAIAAAAILPFLHGCGDENAQEGQVRIVNATTEYTSLDLYTVDSSGGNDLVVSGTGANAASAYTGIDKGSYTFDVKSSTSAGSAPTVTGTISKADHFTIVTYLTGSSTKTQFLTDEETAPASGNAKLRVFNAAPSEAASVDVYLTKNACTALAVTDTAFASAVTTLQTSYTQVTADTWNVCVFATGDTSTLLLDIPALQLKNQEIATLVVTHTTGGVLLNAAVLDQQGAYKTYSNAIARVRVVADAASGASVSVLVNGQELAGSTPSVGAYQTIPVGTLAPTIAVGGVATTGFTLPAVVAGNDYTLLVMGTAGAPSATLISDSNTPSTSTTNTVKVRVINGLNNSSGTASATVDSKPVGTAAVGAASPAYISILPTTGTSTVHASTTGTNPADLVNQTFSAGDVYTVFIYGDAAAPTLATSLDR